MSSGILFFATRGFSSIPNRYIYATTMKANMMSCNEIPNMKFMCNEKKKIAMINDNSICQQKKIGMISKEEFMIHGLCY